MGLKEQLAAARKDAGEFIARLKADGHEVTDEELAEARTKSDLVKALESRVERQDALKGFEGLGAVDETPQNEAPARSLGEHFAKAVGDTLRIARGKKGFSVSAPEFKAATDAQSIPTVVAPALTTIDTNIVTGVRRRLTVADLLGSETISGNALTYFVEGALEGDFATVAELGKKPQLHFGDPTPVTEALAKIAGFLKESDEILEDVPWLVSAINNRLLYQLGLVEENQLLSGTGTGGNIRGLLNRSGLQVITAANRTDNADALFRAITAVGLNGGIEADGLVINPADYQTLRLSKDGNGQYFGGGFFAGEYGQGGIVQQPPVWGLRTVVTPAIAQGTALVGAYGQAASVIRKGGVRVETTNSDVDDFEYNRVTVRAEERLALAVRRPAGFAKVTLSSAAPA
ncbi:HK97 family phage major capsid protein [Frigoribacterium sp. PhB107]|uniref:phage major capsid protein n=1 Tax=Frigoribacterium sp. PhB107 TaxID=2485172 RepID=UPI000F48A53D|nr:phage major capsid protein [Frigoribacterium sp. PhB107]ROP78321.1 HK97 family phage major capsid protein [Frigoribacterium sp. PhB107]